MSHQVKMEDFTDFSVETEIAASHGGRGTEKKLMLHVKPAGNGFSHSYTVISNFFTSFEGDDFQEAIDAYNKID